MQKTKKAKQTTNKQFTNQKNRRSMKKQMNLLMIVLALCGSVFFLTGCQDDDEKSLNKVSDEELSSYVGVILNLSSDATWDDIYEISQNSDLYDPVIQYSIPSDDRHEHIGYMAIQNESFHSGEDIRIELEEYVQLLTTMLTDNDINSNINLSNKSSDLIRNSNDYIRDYVLGIQADIKEHDNDKLLDRLNESSFIEHYDIEKDVSRSEVIGKSKQNTSVLNSKSISNNGAYSRMPYKGKVKVGELSSGNRYVLHIMEWDQNRFGSMSTYEHDFYLNNYADSELGPGTYFTKSEKWNRIPRYENAVSNLPHWYVDTRINDPSDEYAYTIGTSKASNIEKYKSYYSLMVLKPGDTDIDNAKLNGQWGYRDPASCHNPVTCIWPNSGHRLVDSWKIDVPGEKYWRKGLLV